MSPQAKQLAELFSELASVEAVALGGSRANNQSDAASDLDVYVFFSEEEPPIGLRGAIIERAGGASSANLNFRHWGPSDPYFDRTSGVEVDLLYFETRWMAQQLERSLVTHEASLGYSTCFWHTLRRSHVLFDRHGWLAAQQERAHADFPEPLRRNIIHLNHSVLRNVIPSYKSQIDKALLRRDLVSVHHRLAALLASYFDVIFALNRELHPGEKRLLSLTVQRCTKLPTNMSADVEAVLRSVNDGPSLTANLTQLLDRLDELLASEGFDATDGKPEPLPSLVTAADTKVPEGEQDDRVVR